MLKRALHRLAKEAGLVVVRDKGQTVRQCPICGYTGPFSFGGHRRSPRAGAMCPQCRALERHRLLYLALDRRRDEIIKGKKILHFAPEPFLRTHILREEQAAYVTADLFMPGVDAREDITALSFADESFDTAICIHVLEHVADDRAAMRELARVLRPGGVAVVMVPLIAGWETTYEAPEIVAPEERTVHFGQHDHVRFYGQDFAARLAEHFTVESVQASPAECALHGLTRGETVFLARKPA